MGRRTWNLKRVKQFFACGSLKLPAIPMDLVRSLRDFTPENLEGCGWTLSTRPFRLPPWELSAFVQEAEAGVVADYALLSYGPSTLYGLHYFLVRGGLRLFLQLTWSPDLFRTNSTQARPVARCIALANEIVKSAANAEKEAVFGTHEALTVVASDCHGGWWRRPGEPRPEKQDGDGANNPQSVLEGALAWLKATRKKSDRGPDETPSRRSTRTISWIDAGILSSLGPGVEFHHLYVLSTPVAFIEAEALRESRSDPLKVRILKLIESNPVRIRTKWSSTAEEPWRGSPEVLAQDHPFKWAKIVEDVKRAVLEYLERGGTSLLASGLVRVEART